MALGDASSPIRFGQGQDGSDTRFLYLKVFGGEVLSAYDLNVLTLDKHEVKTLRNAKSAQFPKVWKASSEYHTPGVELLGTDIDTTEVVVTVDDILVSHVAVADLDEMLSHFETRSKFASAMGYELSKVFDKNVFRQIILSARSAADGPFPGGTVITDASLTASGAIDGSAWIDAIKQANEALFNKDVPDSEPRYMGVKKEVFNAIKYAKDANGQYLLLNRDFGIQAGGVSGRGEVLDVDGVKVYATRNLPNTDESANNAVYSKYRANYSTTTGVLWTPMAVATAKVMEIGFETTRDTRRLEDFMVAKMLVGHGKLRPECAVEFKTA
jgi:hypothetical protein